MIVPNSVGVANVKMNAVYLAFGGNIGDTETTIRSAIESLKKVVGVYEVTVSKYYKTKPVSPVPQGDYINAVCHFFTKLTVTELFSKTQQIEIEHGKVEKPKTDPRKIDIDIIHFGQSVYEDDQLKIPHPKWKERLFVLIPMNDLTDSIVVNDYYGPGESGCFALAKIIDNLLKERKEEEVIPLPPPMPPVVAPAVVPYLQLANSYTYRPVSVGSIPPKTFLLGAWYPVNVQLSPGI